MTSQTIARPEETAAQAIARPEETAAQAIARAEETAAQAQENREYVRRLLKARQPQFAAALESAVQEFVRNHGTACTLSHGIPDDRGLCRKGSSGIVDIAGEPTAA